MLRQMVNKNGKENMETELKLQMKLTLSGRLTEF